MSLAAGILIDTLFGPKKVEDLRAGEFVLSEDGRPVPLLALVPMRVATDRKDGPLYMLRAGAMGRGRPARSMILSPGQLVASKDGTVPARDLADGRQVLRVWPHRPMRFFQPVLADGGVFMANGVALHSPQVSTALTHRLLERLPADPMLPFLRGAAPDPAPAHRKGRLSGRLAG